MRRALDIDGVARMTTQPAINIDTSDKISEGQRLGHARTADV
jgi:hypothetical protein